MRESEGEGRAGDGRGLGLGRFVLCRAGRGFVLSRVVLLFLWQCHENMTRPRAHFKRGVGRRLGRYLGSGAAYHWAFL